MLILFVFLILKNLFLYETLDKISDFVIYLLYNEFLLKRKSMEKKPLSKTAKIALGVTVSAIAVTAIAVPTAITLSNNTAAPTSYSITISNNLSANDGYNIVVQKGTKFKDLTVEQKEGYVFGGWFKDMACTQKYNDDDFIDKNLTIFAKWEAKTLALSVDLPTGMSFRFLKTNGEQYTEEELSNIKYGTTMKFEISSDDQVEGTSYAYAVNYDGEEVPHTVVENKFIYSVTLTKEAPIVLEGRFEYAVTTDDGSNEQITIKNYKNYSESEKIIVPEKIANLPVAVIENLSGGDLSQENTVVTSIAFSKTVQSFNAEYLGLFTNLSQVSIPSSNPYLKNDHGIILGEKGNATTVYFCLRNTSKAVVLPTNTVKIETRAFEDCTGVKSVNFEELTNLVSIGDYAFTNSGIETAHLGESVTDIGYSAFNACQNLKSVKVEAEVVDLNGKIGQSEFYAYGGAGDNSSYLAYTFANCPNIEYVYWNANIDYSKLKYGVYGVSIFNNSATNKGATFVTTENVEDSIILCSGGNGYLTLNCPLNVVSMILNGVGSTGCYPYYTEFLYKTETITLNSSKSLSYLGDKNSYIYYGETLYISEDALNLSTEAGNDYSDSLQDILTLGKYGKIKTYQKVQSDREGYLMYTLVEEGE